MSKNIISKVLIIFYLISLSKSLYYIESSQETRAVWVSPWGGDQDLIEFISKDDFIKKMT